jgi:chromate transport protein ChrA
MVIALTVVIPHITGTYPPEADVVSIMNDAIPHVSIVIVAIVLGLLIIGLLGGESKWMGGSLSGWLAIAAFALIIYIFGASANWWEDIGLRWGLWSGDSITITIVILVFAIVIWYVTKSDSDADKASKGMNLVKEFGDMFKGAK